jgi:hypothetical protein
MGCKYKHEGINNQQDSPKVNIVMGNVNSIKIGLATALIIAKTAHTINAIRKSATFIPGNSQHVKYMIPEYTNHLIKTVLSISLTR